MAPREGRRVHILTLPERLELTADEIIEPGEYISENLLGAQLINLGGDGSMTPLKESRPFDESKDWNGKRLLFCRAGGFGDMIELTPALRLIKSKWPKCHIAVASMGRYMPVFENITYVDEIKRYPVPTAEAKNYDVWVFFENAIERNPRAHQVPMADLYAEIIGLKINKFLGEKFDGKPDYVVSLEEKGWTKVQFARKKGIRRLVIQPTTSSKARCYDFGQLDLVLNHFKKKSNWEVFIVGDKGEIDSQDTENVKNLGRLGLTFRQSAAVVAECDVLLANDSAFLHVAGALGVPAVGLFGPFPWKLRTSYMPSVFAIQGRGKCAPCFHHEKTGQLVRDPFPKDCPSRDKGYCEVLKSIKPETIAAKLEKLARPLP